MIRCLVRRSHGNSKLSYLLTFDTRLTWFPIVIVWSQNLRDFMISWKRRNIYRFADFLPLIWVWVAVGVDLEGSLAPVLFWFYLMSRSYSQLGMLRVQHGGAAVLLFMFELLTLALRESRPTLLFCDILWLSSVGRHFMTFLFWSLPRFHDCRWELEQSWNGSCINDVIY